MKGNVSPKMASESARKREVCFNVSYNTLKLNIR